MKKIAIPIFLIYGFITAYGQSNNFPTNGNVTISDGNLVQTGVYNLQTQGAIKLKNYLLLDADGDFTGGNYFSIQDHSTGNYLRFGYGFNDHLVLSSTGNIGIGTNPSTKFQIRKDEALEINSSNITSDDISGIRLSNLSTSANSGAVINFQLGGTGTSHAAISSSRPDADKSILHFYTEHQNSIAERLRITSDGKIGIGTSNLSIAGTGINNLVIGDGSSSRGLVVNAGSSNDGILAFADNSTLVARFIYNNPSGKLHYYKPSSGNLFTIDNSGNVGIGTSSPQSKLAVDGQIRASEVKVLADINVPDYVFEPDYDLRTLKETKEYITENKHLPEIPSATEIGENGIDLGDMNMRLLKKIEELTLYQIELLEKVEELQEKVEKLEKN